MTADSAFFTTSTTKRASFAPADSRTDPDVSSLDSLDFIAVSVK